MNIETSGATAAKWLEPDVLATGIEQLPLVDIAPEHIQASIAISLKRIADALDDVVRNGAAINVDHRP